MHRNSLLALLVSMLLATSVAFAKQPTTQPAEPRDPSEDEYVVSKMRVQEMKAHKYFYKEFEASMTDLATIVTPTIEAMFRTMKENNIEPEGSVTFVYHGATQDPTKKFKLQIGIIVTAAAVPAGDFLVRDLETFRCATVIFGGAIPMVGKAYQQLFTDLFSARLEPTGETRETYLLWEDMNSPNNITLIQAGVK